MDYTHLYRTCIQKTFDEDQADILSAMQSELAKSQKHGISVINYYKGLPVSSVASVVGIEKNILDLDVTPQQAVAISKERYTFIRSKLFRHAILAKAQYVSIKHKAVSLHKLCFVEIMAESRRHLRLEVEPPMNALFNGSAGIVRGRLIELSLGGAVMTTPQSLSEILGEETNLSFMVPDIEQNTTYNIKLPAKIMRVVDETTPMQYIFSIKTDDRISDRVIAKYLFHRQVEIVRDLKDQSELGTLKSPVVAPG